MPEMEENSLIEAAAEGRASVADEIANSVSHGIV